MVVHPKKGTNFRKSLEYGIKLTGLNFDQIADGTRSFVIVFDDKKDAYQIGDLLIIQKYSGTNKKVGEPVPRVVKSFQKSGLGLRQGFIILGIEEPVTDGCPRINLRFNDDKQLEQLEKAVKHINKKSKSRGKVTLNCFAVEAIMTAAKKVK